MATKKSYCRCSALAVNKDVDFPWEKAEKFGARGTESQCRKCGYWKWTFPSALAVKKWYKEVRQNSYLLEEVVE